MTLSASRRAHLDRFVRWMDELVRVPGTRIGIGLDPILGLVPGLGDAIGTTLSLWILGEALVARVPTVVLLRMGINVLVDAAVSAVPVAGDVGDVFITANRWNLRLLERYAGGGRRPSAADYAIVGGVALVAVAAAVGTVVAAVLLLRLVLHALFPGAAP